MMKSRNALAGLAVYISLACISMANAQPSSTQDNNRLTLWYREPAKVCMDEALPVGNGRLGAMIFGTTGTERIVLDEDSLWTGDENPGGDYNHMGAYQFLGELRIVLPGHEAAQNYRRDLDIGQALAHVSYDAGGVSYQREVFASHPAQVLVVRLTASRPGSYTGQIELRDSHRAKTASADNRLSAAGALDNGLKYETQLVALHQGGTLRPEGGTLRFSACDSLTLIVGAGTDYAMNYSSHYRGADPHQRVIGQVNAAAAKPFEELRSEHVADFRSLLVRVSLDLGPSTPDQRAAPTNRTLLRPPPNGVRIGQPIALPLFEE